MRFAEVSDRLTVQLNYPGNEHDGQPLNVAIPNMEKVRIWQAMHGGYSWAIAYEPGVPSWNDAEKKEWCGYTASYRKIGHNSSSQTIRIDGGPWSSFADAERACGQRWRAIRKPS